MRPHQDAEHYYCCDFFCFFIFFSSFFLFSSMSACFTSSLVSTVPLILTKERFFCARFESAGSLSDTFLSFSLPRTMSRFGGNSPEAAQESLMVLLKAESWNAFGISESRTTFFWSRGARVSAVVFPFIAALNARKTPQSRGWRRWLE